MHAPQIIYFVLILLTFGLVAAKHGKPIDEKYSFGAMAVTIAILCGLYYWGGFFDSFGLPQGILSGYYALVGGVWLAKDGEPRIGSYNLVKSVATSAVSIGLLYWGGFFG